MTSTNTIDTARVELLLSELRLPSPRLPAGKTFDTFDFNAVPMVSKAQVMALAAGDGWLDQGANILLFGPPGGGKSHLAAALGLALVKNGRRALFMRTTDLVQRLRWRAGSWGSKAPSSSSTSTSC